MDEQDAQRNVESGVKIHDYTPGKANRSSSSPGARTFEIQEEARPQARTFQIPEDNRTQARTFEIQDDVGQAKQKSSEVATVSAESGRTGVASMAQVFLAWQREVYWFINTRLNNNIQFFRQVSETNAPSDFGRIQSQYAQEAITDYTFGVQQVLARSLSAAREGQEQMRYGAEKAASQIRSGTEQLTQRD